MRRNDFLSKIDKSPIEDTLNINRLHQVRNYNNRAHGVGDAVAIVANPVAEIYKFVTGKDLKGCGCPGRKKRLNNIFSAEKREVQEWAVGITTAPRNIYTLKTTVNSVVNAGWDQLNIFAEPGSYIDNEVKANFDFKFRKSRSYYTKCTVCNTKYFGTSTDQCRNCSNKHISTSISCWPNFFESLQTLRVDFPDADAYIMFQDDILLTKNLRYFLETNLWPFRHLGCVSLYCSGRFTRDDSDRKTNEGLILDRGAGFWGALALIFPANEIDSFLSNKEIHDLPGNRIDQRVGRWCRRTNKPMFVYRPSMVDHIGYESSVGHAVAEDDERMRGCKFPGQSHDMVYNIMNIT